MKYNWTEMVDITVPVGTNGWLYSGELIINGVKVSFPVGVPTSVPAPAAALLQQMIVIEQEADKTAKPNNHYVGSLTVPAGKTLTLQPGTKVVDADGVLGAGASKVLLDETALTVDKATGMMTAQVDLAYKAEQDKLYTVIYNDAEYKCKAYIEKRSTGAWTLLLGKINYPQANNDAPFAIIIQVPAPGDGKNAAMQVMPQDGAETATVSIMEKTEPAGGGLIVRTTLQGDAGNGMTYVSFDKTFGEIMEAIQAGRYVACHHEVDDGAGALVLPVVSYAPGLLIAFSVYSGGATDAIQMMADGTGYYMSM